MISRPTFAMRLLVTAAFAGAAGCSGSQPATERTASPLSEAGPVTGDPQPSAPGPVESGFQRLRLSDFETFFGKSSGPQPTWTEEGPVLRCTGTPRGYIYSKRSFRDFTLRLDYRYPEAEGADQSKLNTGVLIFITGKHKQWPVSLEVQGKFPEMGTIKANGGAVQPEIEDDESVRQSARKPPREWNSLEITARSGAVSVLLNGMKVCESQQGQLIEGPVGLQSEDAAVEFRNVRISTAAEPTGDTLGADTAQPQDS